MNKDLELYLEEQRQFLLNIDKSIKYLSDVFSQKVAVEIKPLDKMNIDGAVEVKNTLTVENIKDIQDWLNELGETIRSAIENNSYRPEKNITVDNIDQAKPTQLKINNFQDLKLYFENIQRAIENNQPIVNVEKQEIRFPTSAKEAIPVRLSDGKSFYNAIMAAVSGQKAIQIVDSTGNAVTVTDNKLDVNASEVLAMTSIVSGAITYLAQAAPGSSASNAVWRAMKIDETTGAPIITWADGNSDYDNIATNLASLSYS